MRASRSPGGPEVGGDPWSNRTERHDFRLRGRRGIHWCPGDRRVEERGLARREWHVGAAVAVAHAAVGETPDDPADVRAEDTVGVVPVDDVEATVARRRVQPRLFPGEADAAVV